MVVGLYRDITYNSYFKDKKTETQKGSNFKFTQLGSEKVAVLGEAPQPWSLFA